MTSEATDDLRGQNSKRQMKEHKKLSTGVSFLALLTIFENLFTLLAKFGPLVRLTMYKKAKFVHSEAYHLQDFELIAK